MKMKKRGGKSFHKKAITQGRVNSKRNLASTHRETWNKRAVSPVIATIILIAIVIVIAVVIFAWFRGSVNSSIQKFGADINQRCDEALDGLSATYSSGKLQLVNNGNVAIFDIRVRTLGGSREVFDLSDKVGNWGEGLTIGKAGSYELGSLDSDSIELIPILLGNSNDGQVTYPCRDGIELSIN